MVQVREKKRRPMVKSKNIRAVNKIIEKEDVPAQGLVRAFIPGGC